MGVTRTEAFKLFLITAVPFAFYLFKPDIFGSDGYAFLLWTCQGLVLGQGMFNFLIFEAIPCNIIAIKCILFLLCFCSVLAIANLGKLFWNNGWFAGVLAFTSPIIVYEFFKFENDQFAIPLIFWSVYFFVKGLVYEDEETRLRSSLYAAGLLIVAGFIWEAAALMLFAFALGNIFFTFLSIPVFVIAFPKMSQVLGFAHWGRVSENTPLIALGWLGFLLLGCVGLIKGNKAGWRFTLPAILLFIIIMFNSKFAILLVPFLSVGLLNAWNTVMQKEFKTMIVLLCLFFPFFYGFQSLGMQPTANQWEAIDYAIKESGYEMMQNDWDLGWWVKWHGGVTDNYAGANSNFKEPVGIVLTRFEELDCPILKDFNGIRVYDCH